MSLEAALQAIGFHDIEKLENLQAERNVHCFKIWLKLKKAKEAGDEKALHKLEEAIRKHQEKNAIIKKKALAIGFNWT